MARVRRLALLVLLPLTLAPLVSCENKTMDPGGGASQYPTRMENSRNTSSSATTALPNTNTVLSPGIPSTSHRVPESPASTHGTSPPASATPTVPDMSANPGKGVIPAQVENETMGQGDKQTLSPNSTNITYTLTNAGVTETSSTMSPNAGVTKTSSTLSTLTKADKSAVEMGAKSSSTHAGEATNTTEEMSGQSPPQSNLAVTVNKSVSSEGVGVSSTTMSSDTATNNKEDGDSTSSTLEGSPQQPSSQPPSSSSAVPSGSSEETETTSTTQTAESTTSTTQTPSSTETVSSTPSSTVTTSATITTTPTTTTSPCPDGWEPGNVTNIRGLLNSTNQTVSYWWEPPPDTPPPKCITQYNVSVTHLGSREEHVTREPSLTVSTERTCMWVNISVLAVSTEGAHGTAQQTTLRLGDGAPGPVNITANEKNTTYIRINFTSSSTNPSCVEGYRVSYTNMTSGGPDMPLTVPATQLYADLTDLEACTNYSVRVAPLWNGTPGEFSSTHYIVTAGGEPGPPRDLNLTEGATPHEMVATWLRPDTAANCLTGYLLSLKDETNSTVVSREVGANTTSHTFTALYTCRQYHVEIVSRIYEGNSSTVSKLYTAESEAPPAPSNVTMGGLGSRWLQLQWMVPESSATHNDCPVNKTYVACSSHSVTLRGEDRSVNVTDLRPETNYSCSVVLGNQHGNSSSSNIQTATRAEVPKSPENIGLTPAERSILVTWEPPTEWAGRITGYRVHLNCTIEAATGCEPKCGYTTRDNYIITGDARNYTATATPDTRYLIWVYASTAVGEGEPAHSSTTTLIEPPQAVKNIQNTSLAQNNSTVTVHLTWAKICYADGYTVLLEGQRSGYPDISRESNTSLPSTEFYDLHSAYDFQTRVWANIKHVSGAESPFSFRTPEGVPPNLSTTAIANVLSKQHEVEDSTSQAKVILTMSNYNEEARAGDIKYWAVLVTISSTLTPGAGLGTPQTPGWWQSTDGGRTGVYEVKKRWNPTPDSAGGFTDQLILGGESTDVCDQVCNGKLHAGYTYKILIRRFTEKGYSDSQVVEFRTNASSALGAILGAIFAVLLIAIIAVLLYLMHQRNPEWHHKLRDSLLVLAGQHGSSGPQHPRGVTPDRFAEHLEAQLQPLQPAGGTKLSEEFRLLNSLSPPPHSAQPNAYSVALLPDNRFKNRYINILPYDETRVVLAEIDDDCSSDYVNANFIKGYSGETEYIASQGPKLETCEDFWRMVHDYDVTVIAMVTQLIEKGKDKCHQYYPNLRETADFGHVCVKCVNEVNFPVYTSRSLLVQKDNMQKAVTQLHFREWPDFGCPVTTDLMLSFCQTMREHATKSEGLILVHCSAGVGRTGTLIAVDLLLQHLHDNRKLDVFGTVLKLREQRMNMVQTEGQYEYIHKCMKDAIDDPSLLNSEGVSPTDSQEPIYANMNNSPLSVEMDCYPVIKVPSQHKKVPNIESCM